MILQGLTEQIENIQYQAALSITGAWQGTNRSKLYEELGWESLSDRRWCRQLLQLYKIINNKTPIYLKEKLPPQRITLYSRTFVNMFFEIRCKSQRYKNSFFPSAIKSSLIFKIGQHLMYSRTIF